MQLHKEILRDRRERKFLREINIMKKKTKRRREKKKFLQNIK